MAEIIQPVLLPLPSSFVDDGDGVRLARSPFEDDSAFPQSQPWLWLNRQFADDEQLGRLGQGDEDGSFTPASIVVTQLSVGRLHIDDEQLARLGFGDEDSNLQPAVTVVQLAVGQSFADDEQLGRLSFGDEEPSYTTSSIVVTQLSVGKPFFDDDQLGNLGLGDEDGAWLLAIPQQLAEPANFSDDERFANLGFGDEEGWSVAIVSPTAFGLTQFSADEEFRLVVLEDESSLQQPSTIHWIVNSFTADDEQGRPVLTEDEGWTQATVAQSSSVVVIQPADDDLVQLTALEEQAWSTPMTNQPWFAASFAEDDNGSMLTNFGIEEEPTPNGSMFTAAWTPTTWWDEDAWTVPQVIVSGPFFFEAATVFIAGADASGWFIAGADSATTFIAGADAAEGTP